MKINEQELQRKTADLCRAYNAVKEKAKEHLTGGEFYVEERIDENYLLVVSFKNGEQYSIVGNSYELEFCYFEEDQWTFGDLLGGYLDLYYQR